LSESRQFSKKRLAQPSGVVPELTEGLLEQVGGVDALVRREQELERSAPLQRQVLVTRQQRVLLALDEAPVLAREAGVLALAYDVQSLTEVAQHVELVEEDAGLRGVALCGVPERLPHVHHGHRIPALFLGPSHLKNSSMLASERSLPPNQMARSRTRSLTTIR